MRLAFVFLVVLITSAGKNASAQQVPPGVAVRIEARDSASPLVMHGTFQRQARDTLLLTTTDFRPLAVPWKNIERAEYRDGRKPGAPYALLGGVTAGVITSVALNYFIHNGCTGPECRQWDFSALIVLSTALGSGVGGLVGYALRPALWRPLPRLPTDR